MSGAKLEVVQNANGNAPRILISKAALQAQPALLADLQKVLKKNPVVRTDAIHNLKVLYRIQWTILSQATFSHYCTQSLSHCSG